MNIPKFLEETELLVRTYEKDIFDKKIGDLCIESTENDTWLECNVDSIFTFAQKMRIFLLFQPLFLQLLNWEICCDHCSKLKNTYASSARVNSNSSIATAAKY